MITLYLTPCPDTARLGVVLTIGAVLPEDAITVLLRGVPPICLRWQGACGYMSATLVQDDDGDPRMAGFQVPTDPWGAASVLAAVLQDWYPVEYEATKARFRREVARRAGRTPRPRREVITTG